MKTIMSRTLSVHNEHEFLLRLEKAGLNEDRAQKVVGSKDNALAEKLMRLIDNGGFEPTTSQKHAREIMGKNFFGIEEAIKYFGINSSRQQLAALSEIPWSEATLKEYKNTHVLVAVFPLSILEIRGKVERSLFYSHEDAWYNKESFTKSKGEASWQLVRKTPVENSTNKTWSDQQTLLAKNEETPTAQVMVYTIIGHFLSTGERLFENVYVRCSDLGSGGSRVHVGDFDSKGLDVGSYSGGACFDSLGLASARKFN
jgi:hypothetical protein